LVFHKRFTVRPTFYSGVTTRPGEGNSIDLSGEK